MKKIKLLIKSRMFFYGFGVALNLVSSILEYEDCNPFIRKKVYDLYIGYGFKEEKIPYFIKFGNDTAVTCRKCEHCIHNDYYEEYECMYKHDGELYDDSELDIERYYENCPLIMEEYSIGE